ncbi:tripartite tricarboxylate transporter substrate binding protein [Fusibacter ferrireducens]|uniref:Tripartite tricarboxylate transporter substrate binding protein n=1 Tax=Fusibacter ferrireducens TaxID=2785058 RepID=A0ABR9ZNR7_9FIRM|nr:tripartite tricarboxylate transporter substrate binding protein [Fusibacter ferrireducens]MBF4692113.1 tripartite tricarboxylate transporter substrate binding protein [Fusibacter ferrireducens]
MRKGLVLVGVLIFLLTTVGCAKKVEPAASETPAASTKSEVPVAQEEVKTLAFPEKDITLIVPFAAGGGTDTMARIFAKTAGKNYLNGHQIIVENKAGGGAVIGQSYVANTADPDGYTVMIFTSSAINNTLLKDVDYSYEDFKPIVGCNPDAEIVVVPVDSPYNTLDEFVAGAKENALKISTPGHSSGHHIRGLNMARLLDLKFNFVHSDSAAMQLTQIMGGHVDAAFMTVGETAGPISDGQVKALGIMAKERNVFIPEVKTFLEQGYEGWIDGANRGIACSVNVPDDVYNYLVEEFGKIANSEEFVKAMTDGGMTAGAMTPAEYQDYINFTAEGITALKPMLQQK